MNLVLYAGTIILSTTQATLGKFVGSNGNQTVFNLNKCIAAFLMFALFEMFDFSFNTETLFYGLAFGVFLYLATWSSLSALICGPMSLTLMLASFSLAIPCIYGIAFLNEPCGILTIIGFALLSVSFVLLCFKKKNDKAITAKWLIITVVTVITNGICSVVLKLHQIKFPGQYQNTFMMIAYFVAAFMFFIELLIKYPTRKIGYIDVKGAFSGIANGGGNFLTIFLASLENASVMFPIISVLSAITSLGVGKLIFKEKLTAYQITGFVLGIVSVVLLKL